MTYSLESLVFRAVGCAVNTAARAANNLLEVMYPREDIAHIWDDSPREGVEAALADPHPVGVDDAAGVVPPTPAASLTWHGWAVPAILDVLSDYPLDWGPEELADEIANRIACDRARAIAALRGPQIETGHDMGLSYACEFFPQHTKPKQ